MNQPHFGEHVTIDGYGGDPAILNDRGAVLSALEELCTTLGMHPLAPAQIQEAPDNQLKDPGGWSAFLMIVESHMSIHTFPKRRFLSADVYTCKNGMDVGRIETFFKERFGLDEVETHFVKRGLKYPEHNLV